MAIVSYLNAQNIFKLYLMQIVLMGFGAGYFLFLTALHLLFWI